MLNFERKSIAVIGVGAVFEQLHHPAIKRKYGKKLFIDPAKKSIPNFEKIETIDQQKNLDTILLATPPSHRVVWLESILKSGFNGNLIVEKPIAATAYEYQLLSEYRGHLFCPLLRRYTKNSWRLLLLIEQYFNVARTVTYREGGPFTWPVSKSYFTDKRSSSLFWDTVPHILSLLPQSAYTFNFEAISELYSPDLTLIGHNAAESKELKIVASRRILYRPSITFEFADGSNACIGILDGTVRHPDNSKEVLPGLSDFGYAAKMFHESVIKSNSTSGEVGMAISKTLLDLEK